MDHRTLFVQFGSSAEATTYQQEVRALFDRHVEHLKTLDRKQYLSWHRQHHGLTPPMLDFAKQEGFEWDEEDGISWDDDDLDPNIHIFAVGQLAVVTHAACLGFGERGLAAFAKLRGATASAFWDPDPTAIQVRVKLGSPAAEKAVCKCAEEADWDEEVLTRQRPEADSEAAEVEFRRGRSKYYLAELRALPELLEVLSGHEVDVELTVKPPSDRWKDLPLQTVHVIGHLRRSARRLGADHASFLRFVAAVGGRPVTEEELDAVAPEVLAAEVIAELRERAEAFERTGWKLAAMNPVEEDELKVALTRHEGWASLRPGPLHWSTPLLAYAESVQTAFHDDAADGQAFLDHRDLRGRDLAERNLRNASLVDSIVDGVSFRGASLEHARATDMHAENACFDGAKLDGADLSRSRLRGSSFRGARCLGTSFADCDVTGCDFRGATVSEAWQSLVPKVVVHAKFGEGVVVRELEGDKLEIRFDSGTTKTLARSFVREV